MGWKDLSYARKGAIIGLIFPLSIRYLLEFGFFERLYLGYVLYLPTRIFSLNYDLPSIAMIISCIFWIIIGALIGWIVGKIKSSRKKK